MEDAMKYLVIAAGILSTTATAADVPELTVYTYDSFVSDWGPGPAVEEAFEAVCGCDLKLVGAGDGAAFWHGSGWKAYGLTPMPCWDWIPI
jgi:thiamine transport system substrate-binding protein